MVDLVPKETHCLYFDLNKSVSCADAGHRMCHGQLMVVHGSSKNTANVLHAFKAEDPALVFAAPSGLTNRAVTLLCNGSICSRTIKMFLKLGRMRLSSDTVKRP